MKKNIVLFIFLLLSAIGLEYETQAYTTGSMSGTSYGIVGLSALLALLYIVPALLLIRQLGKKWQTPAVSLGVALLGGLFISGWTSGLANTYIHEWVSTNFPNTLLSDLENAIAAPLVEEPLKLLAVAFAVYLGPVKKLKSFLMLGITAGMGFQISEDFSYILSDRRLLLHYLWYPRTHHWRHCLSLALHRPDHSRSSSHAALCQNSEKLLPSGALLLPSSLCSPLLLELTADCYRNRYPNHCTGYDGSGCLYLLPSLPNSP